MNWYVGLSRIEKVQQQPKETYMNVGEVYCGVSIVEVARSIFQYCSVNKARWRGLKTTLENTNYGATVNYDNSPYKWTRCG